MAFIVNTEDVNRYGFRILNSALDFSSYEKNPVLLYNHADWQYPIGKVNNLRLEAGQWVADDPQFDEEDEEALLVKGKYERGYINASSLRVRVLETSEDPELMLPGQKRPTVTKAEVLELSLVTVPGNGHAVRLSADQQNIDDILPIVQLQSPKEETTMSLAKIAQELGVTEATEENILQAIKEQQEKLQAAADQQVENLLALGRRKGFVTDDNVEEYRKLAANEPDVLNGIFEKAQEPKKEEESKLSISKIVEEARKKAGDDDAEEQLTFDKLQRENPEELLRIKREEPEKYAELVKGYKKGVNPAAG